MRICLFFPLLIVTKSPTPFAEMQPQTFKEPPPCFTVACRHSLLCCSPALSWTNCLLRPNIFNIFLILIHQSGKPAAFFLHSWVSTSCFSTFDVWLFGLNSSMKATSDQTYLNIRWMYLGPTGFNHFCTKATAGHLLISVLSAAFSFLDGPPCLPSSWLSISLCFFKRAWTSHLKTPVCFEIFVWQRLCWCSRTTLWILTWNCLPQPHLGGRVLVSV